MSPHQTTLDICRAFAMSDAWSEAAQALLNRNVAGFDAAMRKFHQLKGSAR